MSYFDRSEVWHSATRPIGVISTKLGMSRHASITHKYKVGETVGFSPSRWSMRAPSGNCKVIRLLPHDGGENLYRVKCASEPFERIARESELLAGLSD